MISYCIGFGPKSIGNWPLRIDQNSLYLHDYFWLQLANGPFLFPPDLKKQIKFKIRNKMQNKRVLRLYNK